MARKKNPVSKEEIDVILNHIKKNGSISINNPVDCKTLSNHIESITQKRLSDSTLKRLFGFHDSPFSPAYETISILKEYIEKSTTPNNPTADLIVAFYNPIHFEKIDAADVGFQASCRSIAIYLKENPQLLETVLEPIARSEHGRRFYYDLFPDYDLLTTVQFKGYQHFLLHETSYEGKMFANCLLFLKCFFENDKPGMQSQLNLISSLYEPGKYLHPFVLGRYYQTQLIGNFFGEQSKLEIIISEIFEVEKTQPRDGKSLFLEFPGFHYFACDGLWHIGAYESLQKLSNIALTEFEQFEEFKWKGYYDHLYIFHSLALIKNGKLDEAKKNLAYIKPDRFYFISKSYYEKRYQELVDELK